MAWAALVMSLRYNHQSIVDDSLLIYLGEQLLNPYLGFKPRAAQAIPWVV
jgi:hypothetical protein